MDTMVRVLLCALGVAGLASAASPAFAREEDGKFFGITIVPEKDILLILAGTDKSRDILEAIRTSEFLQKEGLGIAFCSGVEEFVPLGRK